MFPASCAIGYQVVEAKLTHDPDRSVHELFGDIFGEKAAGTLESRAGRLLHRGLLAVMQQTSVILDVISSQPSSVPARRASILPNVFSYNSAISACEKGLHWQQALGLLVVMRRLLFLVSCHFIHSSHQCL